jgi:hypothetical protein
LSDKKIEPDPKPVSQEPLGDDALEQVAGGLGDTGTHEVGHIIVKKKPKIAAAEGAEPGTLKGF